MLITVFMSSCLSDIDILYADTFPPHERVSLRSHHCVSDDAALSPVGYYMYYIIQCNDSNDTSRFYGLRWVLIK